MSASHDRARLEKLKERATADGKYIEAGWLSFRLGVVRGDISPDQMYNYRMAFMAGAQQCMTSIGLGMRDKKGVEKRVMAINKELDDFIKQMRL